MQFESLMPGYYITRAKAGWTIDHVCDTHETHIGIADRLEDAVALAKLNQEKTGKIGVVWIDDNRLCPEIYK